MDGTVNKRKCFYQISKKNRQVYDYHQTFKYPNKQKHLNFQYILLNLVATFPFIYHYYKMIDLKSRLKGGILGLVVGDALGVPVEFKSRAYLNEKPIDDMVGYGTYRQAPGTWSDDSSMTFCTLDSLCRGYNLNDLANNFLKWRSESFWTPYGIVFDIGISTNNAILKFKNSKNPRTAGNDDEKSNGNGSLMRILPMAFYLKNEAIDKRFEIISEVSAITHAHIRSSMACLIYIEMARLLITGADKFTAYIEAVNSAKAFFESAGIEPDEINKFARILDGQIQSLDQNRISSSGYVVDSLEASIWSLLTTASFHDAVLKSVNLGGDTDTTGAITGGLAGIHYGFDSISSNWTKKLARIEDILHLIEKFYTYISV